MMLRLTQADMLAQWKMRRYLEPLRTDCLISRSDGIDIDAYCVMEMRRWYLDLLATAPVEFLAPEPTLSENIIKLQIADNHILSTMKSKSKSF